MWRWLVVGSLWVGLTLAPPLVPFVRGEVKVTEKYPPGEVSNYGLDRLLARLIESSLIAFIAIWVLRFLLVDFKAELTELNRQLTVVAMESMRAGGEVKSNLQEVKMLLAELLRELERQENRRD